MLTRIREERGLTESESARFRHLTDERTEIQQDSDGRFYDEYMNRPKRP